MSPLVSFALRKSCFATFTAASTLPFVCWCPGLPVRCSKPHSLAKLANFSQANCGPLSLITMSGIPCLAKWHFNFFMTVLAFVSGMLSISQKFEKQSTTIRYSLPSMVYRSVPIFSHWRSATLWLIKLSLCCFTSHFCYTSRTGRCAPFSSAVMPGQYMHSLARLKQPFTPM